MKKLQQAEPHILRSKWPLLFAMITILLSVSYYFFIRQGAVGSGSTAGIFWGVSGLVIAIILAGYRIRRSLYNLRLGSLSGWLQAHIYLGVLCSVLIFMHSGFRFTGIFSSFLLCLFLLVVVSGIVGALLYRTIPFFMAQHSNVSFAHEDVMRRFGELLEEADGLALEASGEFLNIYKSRIRPLIKSKSPRWRYLFMDEVEVIGKCEQYLELVARQTGAREIYCLHMICALYIEKEKLIYKWGKALLLRGWLNFHVPLTMAMLTAAMFHVISIMYY